MDLSGMNVDLPTVHEDGRFISAKVSRIVELIRLYDSRLDVVWIPPDQRASTDPAFAITEQLQDGRKVVAFYVNSEAEFDETVLARIYMSDNTKHDVQARIEAQNRAAKVVQDARHREEIAVQIEFIRDMMKSGKSVYRHNGRKFHVR